MARSDQYIGLNDWACNLTSVMMDVIEAGTQTYYDGKVENFERKHQINAVKIEPSGDTFEGFEGPYYLSRYTLPDGRVFTEFLQAEPWSSGPMFFIALKDEEGNVVPESLWTDEEICGIE